MEEIKFKTGKGEFIALKVPKHEKYQLSTIQGDLDLIGITKGNLNYITSISEEYVTRLREGVNTICSYSATIIGLSSSITKEQAEAIVDRIKVQHSPYNDWGGGYSYSYTDYLNIGDYAGYGGDAGSCSEVLDSFKTLMKVNSINKNDNWLIIQVK